ncbi:MAG TPA: hypothetical protein VFK35_04335 [Candidatus Limnocylindrales bacterium]|nr:hypothetical protein [Candidatus Limnocylindrales bacterium]
MLKRLWTGGLAGGGALVLVFALSGMVAAATVLTALTAPAPETAPITVDTTATFEDLDGNGVDDDCQEGTVEADPSAEASAAAAVDVDGDGTVSVTEAAHSDRTGGTNCNHGGYVSFVAAGDEETEATEVTEDAPAECEVTEPLTEPATVTETGTVANADEALVVDEPAANAHGKAVSDVARSDAVGGKNCNHGGAVSEAAHDKADQDAAKAARDEAKAARAEARAAAKAARDAARAERKANRGKGHGG